VLAVGDAWMPNHARNGLIERAQDLRRRAERSIDLMVMGVPPDPKVLEAYANAGFRRALHWLPSVAMSPLQRALDYWEGAVADLHGE
jgi:hypothetical protein